MSARRQPTRETDPLPKVRRACGVVKVRQMALKILQQQLADLEDRRLTRDEREFLINAVKCLTEATKVRVAQHKDGGAENSSTGNKDPLATLRG